MLNGIQVGPYKFEDVQGWVNAGYVKLDDTAWYDGCEDWVTLKEVPGIEKLEDRENKEGLTLAPFEAYDGDDPYIFVSYAHKDSKIIFDEITYLKDVGYNIWYDEGIEASSEWPEEIANAVLGCSAFIVFITPRSTGSVNCRNEINLALNEDKPFLAVHLEKSALPPGLRLRMGDLQAIIKYKLTEGLYHKKVSQALEQLLGRRKKKKRSGPTTIAKVGKSGSTSTISAKGARSRNGRKSKGEDNAVRLSRLRAQSKKERVRWLWIGLSLLVAFIGGIYFMGSGEREEKGFVEGQPWMVPSIQLEMNWCDPGTFYMGSPEKEMGRGEDEVRHEVTLSQGFFLGKIEVTQAQWKKVMGTSPSKFFGPDRPVERINWEEARRFCQELSLMERDAGRLPEGWSYDLPTEAQWEYACRAGTDTIFYWGSAIGPSNANYQNTGIGETSEVGKYPSNRWGFHDMLGNVSEFCQDWYEVFNSNALIDPMGPGTGDKKSIRGGAWKDPRESSRVSWRSACIPSHRSEYLGFRLCLKEDHTEGIGEGKKVVSSPMRVLDLTKGLVGWWKFDEGQGKVANDSSIKTRNGELINFDSNETQWVKGVVGTALRFDGKDDYVDVGEFVWGEECSFSGWVKFYDFQRWSRVLDFGNGEAQNNLILSNSEKTSNLVFQNFLTKPLGMDPQYVRIMDFWKLKEWIHVVCQIDESGNSNVFKNGKLNKSQKNELTPKSVRGKQFFGRSNWSVDAHFKGELDDLRIYDRAISEAEVLGLYAQANFIDSVGILVEGKPWTVPQLELEMLWCEPGVFTMGSPDNEPGRQLNENQSRFALSKGFFLGKYEVTQEQYEKIIGSNPSTIKGGKLPVEMIGHRGAVEFCIKLTEFETRMGRLPQGWVYTLPKQAQWEYACRAGTQTTYFWGNEIDPELANYNTSKSNSSKEVGSYQANPWGFFDMHGNVWEWCEEIGVKRGGSFANYANELRSSRIIRTGADVQSYNHGFRVSLQNTF